MLKNIINIKTLPKTMIAHLEVFGKMAFAAILSFILPIYTSILLILLMLFMDFIFKLLVIKKTNEKFENEKAFTFLSKSIVYTLLLVLLQAINPYLMSIPLLSALGEGFAIKVFTLLAFSREMKSIDEKVKIILGFSMLKWIINLLTVTVNKITSGIK